MNIFIRWRPNGFYFSVIPTFHSNRECDSIFPKIIRLDYTSKIIKRILVILNILLLFHFRPCALRFDPKPVGLASAA